MSAQPIPVTLLTGFLGSGKTTLLNALLRDPQMDRVAVVINEFGEIGLDHDLIESATEAMVLMRSGCLCCELRGDLAQTLAGLRDRREIGEVDFDRVVIETTGIADPGPIVQTLVMDGELSNDFMLDGVLATADAATGMATLDRHFEAVQQIAMADRIILTKTDLVSPEERAAFEARLAALNPGAPQGVAVQGAIEPRRLFGVAPRQSSTQAQALSWVAAPAALPRLSGLSERKASPLPLADTGAHDGRITSQAIEIAAPVSPIVFDLWLDALMSAATGILRLKGVVHVDGMAHPFALHGVQHIFHPPVPLPHWPADDRISRIVVIGRDLPEGYLAESLALLQSQPEVTEHRL
ncbi:CobW family GTP-binding protein [Pararhodobacter oceanensis]|uniref:GTP-binding protein n=1 Tax=Pararhodobacter oceanensis TaxID=2172121 RepID=A0A2T8HUV9_9RHOB|nr:GTP-binding protein [Pararhodobacter oceanensis]PVH29211.1 GTP-binding protein [Pararhodobacter oceanensis]